MALSTFKNSHRALASPEFTWKRKESRLEYHQKNTIGFGYALLSRESRVLAHSPVKQDAAFELPQGPDINKRALSGWRLTPGSRMLIREPNRTSQSSSRHQPAVGAGQPLEPTQLATPAPNYRAARKTHTPDPASQEPQPRNCGLPAQGHSYLGA